MRKRKQNVHRRTDPTPDENAHLKAIIRAENDARMRTGHYYGQKPEFELHSVSCGCDEPDEF
jgi:hypothetical protein